MYNFLETITLTSTSLTFLGGRGAQLLFHSENFPKFLEYKPRLRCSLISKIISDSRNPSFSRILSPRLSSNVSHDKTLDINNSKTGKLAGFSLKKPLTPGLLSLLKPYHSFAHDKGSGYIYQTASIKFVNTFFLPLYFFYTEK